MSALSFLYLVLPLPFVFIIHEIERIATHQKWMIQHKDALIARFPNMKTQIEYATNTTTKGCIVSACEKLIIILVVSASILIDAPIAIWSTLFIAFSLHLCIHILQGCIVKSYIPGLVTAIVLLPYSFLGLQSIWNEFGIGELTMYVLLGCLCMALNQTFVQWLVLKSKL